MKIRIEGCTAEDLASHVDYLSLGKIYEGKNIYGGLYVITNDEGHEIDTLVDQQSAHLPYGAHWVEVSE